MQKPTESELTILHLLWKMGPSTVREINDVLNESGRGQRVTEVGYTTTLKLMQIMFEKGLVDREEICRMDSSCSGRTSSISATSHSAITAWER